MLRRRVSTIRFDEVKATRERTFECAGCGKRIKRQKTDWATINPWNVDENGNPKTYEQVRKDVSRKLDKWEAEPKYCSSCNEKQ